MPTVGEGKAITLRLQRTTQGIKTNRQICQNHKTTYLVHLILHKHSEKPTLEQHWHLYFKGLIAAFIFLTGMWIYKRYIIWLNKRSILMIKPIILLKKFPNPCHEIKQIKNTSFNYRSSKEKIIIYWGTKHHALNV